MISQIVQASIAFYQDLVAIDDHVAVAVAVLIIALLLLIYDVIVRASSIGVPLPSWCRGTVWWVSFIAVSIISYYL